MAVPVSLQDIKDAMEFQSNEMSSYLNVVTGEVVTISDEAFRAAEAGEDEDPLTGETLERARAVLAGTDYIALPDRFEIDEYHMMERFAESVPDDDMSKQLLAALRGRGAFRYFKDTAARLGQLEHWWEFRDQSFEEIAVAWCDQNKIKYFRP
ncbi:MAG: hypothetical protein IMY80_05390 [Chloroflexi bacterium]|nr:hypothetical protein [Chloroflexota bacterium]